MDRETEVVDDRAGIVRIPTKAIGWLLVAITIPLAVVIFNDIRASVRAADDRAAAALHESATAREAANLAGGKAEAVIEQLEAIRGDIRELRALIVRAR